jgi:exopolysaccharide biosynthesis polyprenyl glycosylphosphotransferase
MPVIGHLDGLPELVRVTGTAVVIIADIEAPERVVLDAVSTLSRLDCGVWLVPRLGESGRQGGMPDHIGAIPVVQMRPPPMETKLWRLKRVTDVAFATLALVVLSPIMLLCALAIRIESGPGVFFRQQRTGLHGTPFQLIKFRSMRPANEVESQTRWSVAADPRIGPVGRFLRRTSLDELPQLWNVLRGDMTVVGPRPERPYFVDRFSAADPDYSRRHRVPVGLTGLAQVSGLRGDTPISDRARFDNFYIEHWSPWLDFTVLLRTVREVLLGGGR